MAAGLEEHKKGSEQYVCDICHQLFFFTTVQILKHRRTCQGYFGLNWVTFRLRGNHEQDGY